MVVALMAGLSALVVSGSGMLTGTRMRSAAMLIMSSVRMGVTRANSVGRPVRLVFDLDTGRLTLEETRGRMLRVQSADEGAKAGAAAAPALAPSSALCTRSMRPRVSSRVKRPASRSNTSRTGRPTELARVIPMRTLLMINVAADRIRVPVSMPLPLTTRALSPAMSATTTNTSTSENARP